MKFKKIKYHILAVFLLVVFGLTIGFTTTTLAITDPPTIEEPEPEGPNVELPDVSDTLASFKTWYQMYEYAMELQAGYPSLVARSNNQVTTTIPVIGDGVQYLKVIRTTTPNERLDETYTRCDVSLGSNMYRSMYMADGYVYTREITNTANFNFDEETFTFTDEEIKTQTVEERQANKQVIPCEEGIMPSRSNCTGSIDRYSNSNYYILKLDYDISELPETYILNMSSTGQVKSVTMKSIKINLYINKTTGMLYRKETTEEYNMVPSLLNVTLSCSGRAATIYTSYDEILEIDKGY